MWGWAIEFNTAMQLLSRFTESGHSYVDCSTNYPINGDIRSNGLALQWINMWLQKNQGVTLNIIVKVGSINNSGDSLNDISSTAISSQYNYLLGLLGDSLNCIMIHWDNRAESDIGSLTDTINAMRSISANSHAIGLSGIRCPRLYSEIAPDLIDKWVIEVKETALDNSSRQQYLPFFKKNSYYVYGINTAGLLGASVDSNSTSHLRRVSLTPHQRDAFYSAFDVDPSNPTAGEVIYLKTLKYFIARDDLSGVIVGPRNLHQLDVNLKLWDIQST
jgi:aryl-alcohol dehydrogenase-like predicted oxidoreductase